MVNKFTPVPYYPQGFRRGKLADNQSDLPSQQVHVPPPFSPERNPDVVSTPPPVVDIGIVRASFDSRPPRSFDFFWEDAFLGGASQQNGYTVPVGYVLILRQILIEAYPATAGELLGAVIDQFGMTDLISLGTPFLNVLVDNQTSAYITPTQGVQGIPLFDLFAGDVQVDCFMLVPQGSNISIAIPGITTLASSVAFNVIVQYYGNLVQATGRNLVNEVGNPDPAPVQEFDTGA